MVSFGDRLKLARKQKKLTQAQLGKLLRVVDSTISNWEKGITEPSLATISKIANVLGVRINQLVENSEESQNTHQYNALSITTKKMPLLGEIAAGTPIFADENFGAYVEAGNDIRCDFCLKVKGDSMINARIFDGDIVFIRQQSDVDDGQIAVVIVDDEATLKRVYRYYNQDGCYRLELRAENPLFPPLNYEREELNHIRIIGLAVAFQSDIR